MRLAVGGLAPVKQHDTAKDLCLSPVSHYVSSPVRVLLNIPILFVNKEGWQFAIRVKPVKDLVIRRGHPFHEILVIAQIQVKFVQVDRDLVNRNGNHFDQTRFKGS